MRLARVTAFSVSGNRLGCSMAHRSAISRLTAFLAGSEFHLFQLSCWLATLRVLGRACLRPFCSSFLTGHNPSAAPIGHRSRDRKRVAGVVSMHRTQNLGLAGFHSWLARQYRTYRVRRRVVSALRTVGRVVAESRWWRDLSRVVSEWLPARVAMRLGVSLPNPRRAGAVSPIRLVQVS